MADLEPIRGMTGMQTLYLYDTQVADLSPIVDMAELRDLNFRGIPACRADPVLEGLSKIRDDKDRTSKTLAYLREEAAKQKPPAPPLSPEDLPPADAALPVLPDAEGRLDVPASAPAPEEAADPLRQKLLERLRGNVALLSRKGNRWTSIEGRVRRLAEALTPDLAEVDLVDVYLDLEELRLDLALDNAAREVPYDDELLTTLETVVNQGAGLVLGTEAVELLEARKAQMREQARADSDETGRSVARGIAEDDTVMGTRLRAYQRTTLSHEDGDDGRMRAVRETLNKNTVLGVSREILIGAAGSATFAAAQWLCLNADIVMAYGAVWSEWAGDWLPRVVEQAKQIVAAAKGSGAVQGRDPRR